VVAAVAIMNIEPGSREDLVFTLCFALKHHIEPAILRGIAARRHDLRPGQPEDLEERIAAEAILEHLALAGWAIVKREGFGSKGGTTALAARQDVGSGES
jgi:hypothetical protein